jgi:hypothetical protein
MYGHKFYVHGSVHRFLHMHTNIQLDVTMVSCFIARSFYMFRALSVPTINPLTPNDLQRRRAVNPSKIKIPGKNMREKPTNTPIIHSVYYLCMVASTCFGIALPSSGSVPSVHAPRY